MTTHYGDESGLILQLRLAIARAAQRDSLSWWEDEALTPGADLLLGRLFPRSVTRAASTLALRAALAKHEAVLAEWPQAHHLFDLGDEVEDQLNEVMREQRLVQFPRDPIGSRKELATVLQAIVPEPAYLSMQSMETKRAARLDNGLASLPVADRAVALAWAYTKSDAPGLVVPFYLPASEEM